MCIRDRELTILFSNSTNGHLESCDCPSHPYGGVVRRATYIKQVRSKNSDVLLLDSGDILPPYSSADLAECLFQIYERLNYDAVGIGDQELSFEGFVTLKDKYKIPFLSSNLNYCEGDVCNFIAPKEKIIKKAGLTIAVISVTDPDVFVLYPEKFKKRFPVLETEDAINGFMERNKGKYDYLIVISHSGFDKDKELAGKFPGIDLIVGGHSQNPLHQPHKVGKTLIVQAGPDAQHVGELTLIFDERKLLYSYGHKIVALTKEIPDDPDSRALIEKYKRKQSPWDKQKIKK